MTRNQALPAIPISLRTARLFLRPWNPRDADALHPVLVANVAHLGPWIPAHVATPVPVPQLAERLARFAADFAANRAYRYALLTRSLVPPTAGPRGTQRVFWLKKEIPAPLRLAPGRLSRVAVGAAAFSLDGGRLIGEADLFPRSSSGRVPLEDADHVEVGYWLDAAATGEGFATEAARALVEVAATLRGMTRVEIRCDAANVASAAVPRRLGFRLARLEGDLQVWQKPLAGPGGAGA